MKTNHLKKLGKLPGLSSSLLGGILVAAIGFLDVFTGYEVYVSFLYLLPIILIAWFGEGISIALMSILCAIAWFVADVASGHIYSHVAVPMGNAFMALGMFLVVGYSLATAKKYYFRERNYAVNDNLNG